MRIVYSFAKSTDPNPVTGSHPEVALNPWLQHAYQFFVHKLFPIVISLAKVPLLAYKAGFTQPKVGNPAALLAALISVIIPATATADSDVPYKLVCTPPTTIK